MGSDESVSVRATIFANLVSALGTLKGQALGGSTVNEVVHFNIDRAHPSQFNGPVPALLVRDTGADDPQVIDDTDSRNAMIVLIGVLVTNDSADTRLEILSGIIDGIRALIDNGIDLGDDVLTRDGVSAVDYGATDSFGVDDQQKNTAVARIPIIIRYARTLGVA